MFYLLYISSWQDFFTHFQKANDTLVSLVVLQWIHHCNTVWQLSSKYLTTLFKVPNYPLQSITPPSTSYHTTIFTVLHSTTLPSSKYHTILFRGTLKSSCNFRICRGLVLYNIFIYITQKHTHRNDIYKNINYNDRKLTMKYIINDTRFNYYVMSNFSISCCTQKIPENKNHKK